MFERPKDWQLREIWEDYPFVNEKIDHTYCSVILETGKVLYYRTRNPELHVGDEVLVPMGRERKLYRGKIIEMKNYRGTEVPYPLHRTKYIKQKIG